VCAIRTKKERLPLLNEDGTNCLALPKKTVRNVSGRKSECEGDEDAGVRESKRGEYFLHRNRIEENNIGRIRGMRWGGSKGGYYEVGAGKQA